MEAGSQQIQRALFEEDYLVRTLGALGTSPMIALTELVANSWDAGASKVDIIIPDEVGDALVIRDNGTGLTKEQFYSRWMRLGYNRLKHQGRNVEFPDNMSGHRLAYGRNGVGRHGLLCFGEEYTVQTHRDGEKSTVVISTDSEEQPFIVKSEQFADSLEHGTILTVRVNRNLPSPQEAKNVISARFLHDPDFIVSINGESVPLEEHSGLIDHREVKLDNIGLFLYFIDSQNASRNTLYQGVAFWQGKKLIGEPSWRIGDEFVIDGRTRFAKRYTFVVESNDLGDYIKDDWTGFKRDSALTPIFETVKKYVLEMYARVAAENIDETREATKLEFRKEIELLSPLGRYEVFEAIEDIVVNNPTARQESISIAVKTIINLENTRTGKELLRKIASLSDEEIDGLNNMLEKWTVKDALTVLDEIDKRISVIEAINRLSADPDSDELKVLHPLITQARWLFGPEFDSPEYTSNQQIRTAVKDLFKKDVGVEEIDNNRRRPDIVVLADAMISVTGTQQFDNESNLNTTNRVLIIELKRGKHEIGRKERDQAVGYVEDFIGLSSIIGAPYYDAFVVGYSFNQKVTPVQTVQDENRVERGKIRITTYSQLVDTAEKRLFNLREKLIDRYADASETDLFVQQKDLF